MSKNLTFIICKENYIQSLFSDLTTYGLGAGVFWINQEIFDGNNFVDGILCLMLCLWLFATAIKNEKTKTLKSHQQVIDWLVEEGALEEKQ